MDRLNINIIKNIIMGILIILVIILVINLFNKKDNNEVFDDSIKDVDIKKDYNVSNSEDNLEESKNTKEEEEKKEEDTSNNDDTSYKYSEDDVITYINNMEDDVSNSNNIDKFKTTFKKYFTDLVDFIFYDKSIKGYKFNELTESAKLQVIKAALVIDSKIESYVPNYKDSISSKYHDLKDKLVTQYLDTTISVCSNNQEKCDTAKENFGKIKDKASIGFDYIKKIIIGGKDKVKDYYEIYRNS